MYLTEEDFQQPDVTTSLLQKAIHGGFLNERDLTQEEMELCKDAEWIEEVMKFKCTSCGDYHKTRPHENRCLVTDEEVQVDSLEKGYRKLPDSTLEVEETFGYTVVLKEHSSVDMSDQLSDKTIAFVPNIESMQFSDKAGTTVYVPMNRICEIFQTGHDGGLINNIELRRKDILNWEVLDDRGADFQEIVFRIIDRNGDYSNVNWGGEGPDQGKDAFCSIDRGGRETNILIQMKFNNNGGSINDHQIERSIRKASKHDCRGLIYAAVKTSGDLETDFYDGNLKSRDMTYFRLWSGPELKEMICRHPDLINEYFIN